MTQHKRASLTDGQIKRLVKMRDDGYSFDVIAYRYDVSHTQAKIIYDKAKGSK